MNFKLRLQKPFFDPIFSTNTTEAHDRGYDTFMFAWDVFLENFSERLNENLKDLGPLSIALTDNENINRIVEDFVPYNMSFVKFLDVTSTERKICSYVHPEERYNLLKEGLKLILGAC